MNLLLVEAREINPAGRVHVHDARARHLIHVLHVEPEQVIRVGIVDGPVGTGRVVHVGHGAVDLDCLFETQVPARPPVDLLLALPRPKVLQRLWAQVAALGVGRVMLCNAARVERNYFDTHVLSEAVYRPLLLEGLQQARDTHVPVVSVHRQFRVLVEDALEDMSPGSRRIVADPSGAIPLGRAAVEATGRVLLAVGPEGGWNRFELDLLARHGFVCGGLGGRTLRSDTACIAMLAVVHEALRGRRQ